jgi:hypothetical protein
MMQPDTLASECYVMTKGRRIGSPHEIETWFALK